MSAQRMVQLDWMTGGGGRSSARAPGRACLGRPHARHRSDGAGRDRQDEAIGIIRRLFNGERV